MAGHAGAAFSGGGEAAVLPLRMSPVFSLIPMHPEAIQRGSGEIEQERIPHRAAARTGCRQFPALESPGSVAHA